MKKAPTVDFFSFRRSTRKINPMPRTQEKRVELPRPQLNDRVQVPNGIGTVVEIENDMYLIDLENQPARLWERLSSIKMAGKY
jgi:hypothetical protein